MAHPTGNNSNDDSDNVNDWLSIFPATDSDDENDVNSAAAQRQERIRRAFEISKDSYETELVVLSPSFFRVDPRDVVTVANDDRFGLQNLGTHTRA